MEKETVRYFGIVHQDKGSDLGVSFPDFPGCVSAGSNLSQLRRNAHEALQFHIEGMVEEGLPIPDPTDEAPDIDDAVALVHVSVRVPRLNVKRYNITAQQKDMRAIDTWLKRHGHGRDRSAFLVTSALEKIQHESRKTR
jgi:predicted RNase H-like HicB family nuclease